MPNKALQFGGGYVDTNNAFLTTLRAEHSMFFWFKADEGRPAGGYVLLAKDSGEDFWLFLNDEGKIGISWNQGYQTAPDIAEDTPVLFEAGAQQWCHFGYVARQVSTSGVGEVEFKYYKNGSLVHTIASSGLLSNAQNDTTLKIGKTYASVGSFSGLFDDLRVYSKALTASEILSIYNNESGTKIDRNASGFYWGMNCDEIDGSLVKGIKANGFEANGTISGNVTLVDGGTPFTANAPVVVLADNLVSALNNHSFSMDFTAVRRSVPIYEVGKDTGLKVQVVPASGEFQNSNRAKTETDYIVSVGLTKKISDVETEIPELLSLMQEIIVYLRNLAMGSHYPTSISMPLVYDPTEMAEKKVFLSVLNITYKGMF
jgi:hypothetical protein